MPKVKDGYFEDKKNSILEVTLKICMSKPLYKLTMKDIIKETGLSPGALYASFSDIDDVIVSLINHLSVSADFLNIVKNILNSTHTPEETIEKLIHYCTSQIQSTILSYGKIHYELNTLLTDKKRSQKIVEGITEIQMYGYIIKNIIDVVEENIDSGYFKPICSKESIYAMLFAFFDGLIRDLTIVKCYQYEDVPQSVTFEEKDLPKAFASSMAYLLNHIE